MALHASRHGLACPLLWFHLLLAVVLHAPCHGPACLLPVAHRRPVTACVLQLEGVSKVAMKLVLSLMYPLPVRPALSMAELTQVLTTLNKASSHSTHWRVYNANVNAWHETVC